MEHTGLLLDKDQCVREDEMHHSDVNHNYADELGSTSKVNQSSKLKITTENNKKVA